MHTVASLAQRLDMNADEALEALRKLRYDIDGVDSVISDALCDQLIEIDEDPSALNRFLWEMKAKEERARKMWTWQEKQRLRQPVLLSLRKIMKENYLAVDSFYHELSQEALSPEELRAEQAAFVQEWLAHQQQRTPGGRKFEPDAEQAAAIAEVHSHVKLVARAGSGKTRTIVNRVLFLLQKCAIPPNQVLLLAFNKKAALEMEERLELALGAQAILPHVLTFHALAHAIVQPKENILTDDAKSGSQSLNAFVHDIIERFLESPQWYRRIKKLMLSHFRADWEALVAVKGSKDPVALLEYLRAHPRETLDGKYVKSYGEKVIADFLFEHDVDYEYERTHAWLDGQPYRPDFTIFTSEDAGVVIEYFGMSGEKEYEQLTEENKQYWEQRQSWSLVSLYPSDVRDRVPEPFRSRMEGILSELGIVIARLSEDEIWDKIRKRARGRFTALVTSFVLRCRKHMVMPQDLAQYIGAYSEAADPTADFLRIVIPIYEHYRNTLAT